MNYRRWLDRLAGILIGLIFIGFGIYLIREEIFGIGEPPLRGVIEYSLGALIAFFIATCLFIPERSYRILPVRRLGFVGLILSTATAVAALGITLSSLIYAAVVFLKAQTPDDLMGLLVLFWAEVGAGVAIVTIPAAAILFNRIKPKRSSLIMGTIIIFLLGAVYFLLAHFILF
jgi:hypothetical protein